MLNSDFDKIIILVATALQSSLIDAFKLCEELN